MYLIHAVVFCLSSSPRVLSFCERVCLHPLWWRPTVNKPDCRIEMSKHGYCEWGRAILSVGLRGSQLICWLIINLDAVYTAATVASNNKDFRIPVVCIVRFRGLRRVLFVTSDFTEYNCILILQMTLGCGTSEVIAERVRSRSNSLT